MKAWIFVAMFLSGCATIPASAKSSVGTRPGNVGHGTALKPAKGNELAAFGGGCFWGIEDQFRQVKGVVATAVGYTGGTLANPTYQQVCTHTTGHVETVLVEFNPKKVTYNQLLAEFWKMHDPTQGDRQGPDYGSNYRSVIWTFSPVQDQQAKVSLSQEQTNWKSRITTQIAPVGKFWIAEDYHQQYDEKNGKSCPTPQRP